MANEIQLRHSLVIANGPYQYISAATAFNADQLVAGGPTPGTIAVSLAGIDVDLTQLTTPGMCRITNLDTPGTGNTNYITYGMHIQASGIYIPLGEILPGEFYQMRLYRFLGAFSGTGTGSGGKLHLRAVGLAVNVEVLTWNR